MSHFLSEVFKDTLNLCNTNLRLKLSTKKVQRNTLVFDELFCCDKTNVKSIKYNITVTEERTFDAAREFKGKTAVLNFANPVTPGGGVWGGCRAQEESLCRCSNLYPSLSTDVADREYYTFNKRQDFVASNRCIYSPGVTVFKTDTMEPELLPKNEWFKVDVITMAAHNFKYGMLTDDFLFDLTCEKVRVICNAAISQNVDNLVLGALGCGAFKNPPMIVAKAFMCVLVNEGYYKFFKNIKFAIAHLPEKIENYEAFSHFFKLKEQN